MNIHNNPLIEIIRESNKLTSVKVIMPVWDRVGSDEITYVNMPLLCLQTYGRGDEDVENAIKETITAFCIASEECGLGLESELEFMGWKKESESDGAIVFNIGVGSPFMEEVMETGHEQAFMLDINQEEQLECA